MIINLGFKPNPKQELMLTDTTHRYICYGGAKGGGKTWALRVKAILLAANYDGIKILVIRRTYPELRNNHIQPMMAMLRGIAKYTDTDHTFKFPNGSTIEYGYCATYSDVVRYQGHEYDILMIDEATTITEEVWNELKLCVRGTNGLPKRVYLKSVQPWRSRSRVGKKVVYRPRLPGRRKPRRLHIHSGFGLRQ